MTWGSFCTYKYHRKDVVRASWTAFYLSFQIFLPFHCGACYRDVFQSFAMLAARQSVSFPFREESLLVPVWPVNCGDLPLQSGVKFQEALSPYSSPSDTLCNSRQNRTFMVKSRFLSLKKNKSLEGKIKLVIKARIQAVPGACCLLSKHREPGSLGEVPTHSNIFAGDPACPPRKGTSQEKKRVPHPGATEGREK